MQTKTVAIFCTSLLLSAICAAESPIGIAEVECAGENLDASTCLLGWDMSNDRRAHYHVQHLSRTELDWIDVDGSYTKDAIGQLGVAPETLYRIQACNDRKFRNKCTTSFAAWAPSIRPVDEIPAEMEMLESDGAVVTVSIVKSGSPYVQLSQYNVYLITDIANRAAFNRPGVLIEMRPPTETDSHPSLDHQIMHGVYSVYEGSRAQDKERRRRKNND